MKIVYLRNGSKCQLVEKIKEGKYLVNPYMIYCGYEGEETEALSDEEMVVNEVYSKPPTVVMEKEFQEWEDKLNIIANSYSQLSSDKNKISYEVDRLKQEQTSLEKLKFDLSDFRKAKSVTFFVEGKIQPFTTGKLTGYNSDNRFDLNIKIHTSNGKSHRSCSVFWDSDSTHSSSSNVDMDYGFYFDISDEEITKIAIERCAKIDFSEWSMYQFNFNNKNNHKAIEPFLSQSAIDRVLELEKQAAINSEKYILKQIEDQKEAYFKLTGKKI